MKALTMGRKKLSGSNSETITYKQVYQWWRLMLSPADRNDHTKLELSRAWESPCNWSPYWSSEEFPTILFLTETKFKVREMESIKSELGFFAMLVVSCESRRGGLALLWKEEDVTIITQTYSPNHIDVRVHTNDSMWRLTRIYRHPEEERKSET